MKIRDLVQGNLYRRKRKDVMVSRFGLKDVEVNSVVEFVRKTIDGGIFLTGGNEIEITRENIELEIEEYE